MVVGKIWQQLPTFLNVRPATWLTAPRSYAEAAPALRDEAAARPSGADALAAGLAPAVRGARAWGRILPQLQAVVDSMAYREAMLAKLAEHKCLPPVRSAKVDAS